MADNLSVSVTADTSKLRAQLALAQADLRAFGAETRKLANDIRAGGDASGTLRGQLEHVARQFNAAKSNVTRLTAALREHKAANDNVASGTGIVTAALGNFAATAAKTPRTGRRHLREDAGRLAGAGRPLRQRRLVQGSDPRRHPARR